MIEGSQGSWEFGLAQKQGFDVRKGAPAAPYDRDVSRSGDVTGGPGRISAISHRLKPLIETEDPFVVREERVAVLVFAGENGVFLVGQTLGAVMVLRRGHVEAHCPSLVRPDDAGLAGDSVARATEALGAADEVVDRNAFHALGEAQ